MFSLLRRRGDAFHQRQKKQELWKCVRRILDRNSIAELLPDDDRAVKRLPFCSPIMLQPCNEDQLAECEPILALTKDLCDDGVAIVVPQALEQSQVICVIWQSGPIFLLGDVRQCHYLGGGFWKVGVQLAEVVSGDEYPTLQALSKQLSPEFEWV